MIDTTILTPFVAAFVMTVMIWSNWKISKGRERVIRGQEKLIAALKGNKLTGEELEQPTK